MLTRSLLASTEPLELFGEDKEQRYFTAEERQTSLKNVLSIKPDDCSVWVFAYGSLIWNPIIDYAECCKAHLDGWTRAFCMKLNSGRATSDRPGRMLALVPGQGSSGLVYRLHDENLEESLSLLWTREMSTDSYRARWERVTLSDGSSVIALVFVMSCHHSTYDKAYQTEDIAGKIALASGPLGSNADYLFMLQDSLKKLNIQDDYIDSMAIAVTKLL